MSVEVDHQTGPNPHLLLVEDDPVNQRLLGKQIELSGGRVTIAARGDRALSLWQSGRCRPDLILMDYRLPDMTGLAVAEALQAAGCTAPVVMVSGEIGERFDADAALAGIDRILRKPVTLEDIRSLLAGLPTPATEKG